MTYLLTVLILQNTEYNVILKIKIKNKKYFFFYKSTIYRNNNYYFIG